MANTKISALTALTGANLATDDAFAVVDTSVTTTKKITVAELKLGIMPAPGPIGATTPAAGAFTLLRGLQFYGSTTSVTEFMDSLGTTGLYVNGLGAVPNNSVRMFSAGAVIATITSTGLAVTGTISATGIVTPGTFTTGTRPAKTLGGIIFDTTLNKLLIGGVAAWEVVTSV